MLARLARELPADGFLYEPKWDGFRCLAFRDGDQVDLRSRHGRELARYFPEIVEALASLPAPEFAVDGELLASAGGAYDFPALLARIHPAASRIERLRRETPATFVAFDALAVGRDELLGEPFHLRRRALERLLSGAPPAVQATPITDDRTLAERWLGAPPDSGIDGVVAKQRDLRYQPGVRAMVKVKLERTADCVVAGFRWLVDRPLPSSLLLGLYDGAGDLLHVGVVSAFAAHERERLLETLAPLVTELAGHPWEDGFLLGANPVGRLKGSAGRWTPEMERDWVPVAPALVAEIAYDQLDGQRFRHPARFRRWRPDREPRSCTLEQLVVEPAALHPPR